MPADARLATQPRLRSGPLGKSEENASDASYPSRRAIAACNVAIPRLAVLRVAEVGHKGICCGYRRLLVILIAIVIALLAAPMSESARLVDAAWNDIAVTKLCN